MDAIGAFIILIASIGIGVLIGMLIWWIEYDRPIYDADFFESVKRAFRH